MELYCQKIKIVIVGSYLRAGPKRKRPAQGRLPPNMPLRARRNESPPCFCNLEGEKPAFSNGTILLLNGELWGVADMYCANQECPCYDTVLHFSHLYGSDSVNENIISVDYKLRKSYTIREIRGQIPENAAHDLVKNWLVNKPVWFTDDEVKSRSKQMKRVMARTKQHWATLVAHGAHPAMRAERNVSCPCGSGKKFKVCCGKW